MKKITAIFSFFLLLLTFYPISQTHAANGWTETQPAGDSDGSWTVSGMSDDGQTIILGANSGRLYLSTNGGTLWTDKQLAGDADQSWRTACVSGDGTTLIAGIDGGRLYLSTNSGSNFSEVQPLGNFDSRWRSCAMSDDGQTIWVGTDRSGGFISKDGGDTWNSDDPPEVGNDGVYFTASMSSDGQTILVGTFDEGTLYLSTDRGDTWSVTNGSHTDIIWGASAVSDNGQVMIAAVGSFGSGRAYLSTNGGSSWAEVQPDGDNARNWKWLAMSDSGATILIAGDTGVFYSTNTGSSWAQTDPIGSGTPIWETVAVSSDATKNLAAESSARVYLAGVLPSTATPTPTATPVPNSGGNSGSSSSVPSCGDQSPINTPDLFQIDAGLTQVTLYFTPVDHANKYFITYGNGTATSGYGVEFGQGETHGVISYTINSLSSNTQYSFTVRGGNGCMPGGWGNSMTIKTTANSAGGVSYYKNFVSQMLSVFPKNITNAGGSNALGTSTRGNLTCQQYTVKPGDTFWGIAETNLGSGTKYQSIMISNQLSSTLLHSGQIIKVGC